MFAGNNGEEGLLMDQPPGQLAFHILQLQACLETALAKAQEVPVHYMQLRSSPPVPIWDFITYKNLIEIGYGIASRRIQDWDKTGQAEPAYPARISAD
jgi:hypothetical protein